MSVISFQFAIFVAAVVVTTTWLQPPRRALFLVAVSYLFYGFCALPFVPILAAETLISFFIGLELSRQPSRQRFWLATGIVTIVALFLAFRTYFRGDPFAGPFVVVGLSFYSLQAISYLIDVRTGKLKGPATLLEVALYLSYFPKLIAGPIERAYDFIPKIRQPGPVDADALSRAGTLVALGITRKLIIADPLAALLPAAAFTDPTRYTRVALLASLVGFAFVLYNDFLAYTQVVRGVSLLLGIELSPNFRSPFFATSFADFWNRWHISLSGWLRDYVYMPLSRMALRRNNSAWNVRALVLPPLTTMLISGAWHGGMHMIAWGALHAVFLISERVLGLLFAKPRKGGLTASGRVLRIIIVFALGTAALSLFRMDIETALVFWETGLSPGREPANAWILLPIAVSLGLDFEQSVRGDAYAFWRWPQPARVFLLAVAFLMWFLAAQEAAVTPFVYQGF